MGFHCMFNVLAVFAVTLTVVAAEAKPGCQSNCGNISIPYPFGTGYGCNITSNFVTFLMDVNIRKKKDLN
ncbi:hypothetical protein E1A91_D05G256300v1 [Gossypium mustelinum]|uniref:Wall-associated receptor kinase galacturonan-binding domain-containing protein n=1 Tax=Gossypium mustelinum TaxID=34275 RepID=A0A5D2V0U4_GOSMU|nr:hypothetical protein E1A91_D05G256300v1 [Gossypium mustelinum]